MGAALDVQGDDDACLLGGRLVERDERRMPRIALPEDDVTGFLVREQELPLEALCGTDEEVRAEALVVRARFRSRTRLAARRRCAGSVVSRLTSEFVKSLRFAGNGTSDVSWFT